MATLKDIAQRAGVTATTVSRVINNRGYISEGTRKKVYAAMEEMHYQPNELARAFSKQYTNTIGLIVPHISHPFFTKVISNIESSAAEKGLSGYVHIKPCGGHCAVQQICSDTGISQNEHPGCESGAGRGR